MKFIGNVLLVFFLLMIVACAKEDFNIYETNHENVESSSEVDIEEARQEIMSSLDDVVDLGDYFLVENDIMIPKESFDEYITTSKQKGSSKTGRHFYTSTVNTPNNGVRTINLFFHKTTFPASETFTSGNTWNVALTSAIVAWNNNDSKLRFNRLQLQIADLIAGRSIPLGTDIVVRSDDGVLRNSVVASAGFPTNGNPYPTILINVDFLNGLTLSSNQKRYNLMHEIGHCVGFRHTNLRILGEPQNGAIPILVTPNAEDPDSVFNGGTALEDGNWSTFDRIAITDLY